MFRTNCLGCGSRKLVEIVNLGMHPMADTFIEKKDFYNADKVYPLICDLCQDCAQIQLRTITNPDERYVEVDYSYTASNSTASRAHWDNYASEVSNKCKLLPDDFIIEIGSNDGYLLQQFKILGFRPRGVEPSPTIAKLATQAGLDVDLDYFSSKYASSALKSLKIKPKLIVANNVFNHSNDPLDFAEGIKILLDDDGIFVFELPYWLTSIEENKFDQIYHEHVSYFTVTYSVNLFNKIGMKVIDVELVDYHGGSIRVYVTKNCQAIQNISVSQFISKENSARLFEIKKYEEFTNEIIKTRNIFLKKLYSLIEGNVPVVCIGAAAKGNTFLNFYNLDSSVINFITDASDNKLGKYTPRTRILITEDSVLSSYGQVVAIILSWNIAAMLKNKLASVNKNILFISPYEI